MCQNNFEYKKRAVNTALSIPVNKDYSEMIALEITIFCISEVPSYI